MDILVALQSHRLGGHLGVGGVGALADLGFAALHGDGAVQVQQHTVAGGLQRDGIDGGVVPERRHADAAADVAGILGVFRLLPVVFDVRLTLFQALTEGVVVVGVAGEAVVEALGHDVLHAVLQGVHAHRLGALVDVGVVGEGRLGHTVAAHGSRHGAVGVDRPRIALEVVAGVDLGEGAHRLRHDGVAVGGVAALVGEALHLPGGDGAVLAEPRDNVEADGVADAVGDERLLTGAVHADATAAHLRGAPRAQRLVQGVLLVAEAAADVGLDDLHVRPGTAQGLPHDTADDVGDLGGRHHHDAPVLLVGKAAVVFDVAVLHGGGVVPALHLDESRLLNGGLVIALADVGVLQDIVGAVLVYLGGVGRHGLLRVQHEGQLLILHLQRTDALHGGDLVLRNDHGDIVAVVPHMAVQQVAVRHVLMAGVHGPGVARRGEAVLRHVEAGQHLHHAVDGLRRGCVNGLDVAVGDGGVLDAGVQRARGHPVLVVFRPPGGLVKGIHADLALSHLTHSRQPPVAKLGNVVYNPH